MNCVNIRMHGAATKIILQYFGYQNTAKLFQIRKSRASSKLSRKHALAMIW